MPLGFKSANAAEEHLRALQKKGVLDLVPGASRGIQLKDSLNALNPTLAGDSEAEQESGFSRWYAPVLIVVVSLIVLSLLRFLVIRISKQLKENLESLDKLEFDEDEIRKIDEVLKQQ